MITAVFARSLTLEELADRLSDHADPAVKSCLDGWLNGTYTEMRKHIAQLEQESSLMQDANGQLEAKIAELEQQVNEFHEARLRNVALVDSLRAVVPTSDDLPSPEAYEDKLELAIEWLRYGAAHAKDKTLQIFWANALRQVEQAGKRCDTCSPLPPKESQLRLEGSWTISADERLRMALTTVMREIEGVGIGCSREFHRMALDSVHNICKRTLDALPVVEPTGWQPIETAPRCALDCGSWARTTNHHPRNVRAMLEAKQKFIVVTDPQEIESIQCDDYDSIFGKCVEGVCYAYAFSVHAWRAHRTLFMKHHPDRGGDTEKTARINRARDQGLATI